MVQTETVTRQALEERVRPVLYINKIDRLIKELRLNSEQIQERIGRIITEFNRLIELYAEPEYREKWKVSFARTQLPWVLPKIVGDSTLKWQRRKA